RAMEDALDPAQPTPDAGPPPLGGGLILLAVGLFYRIVAAPLLVYLLFSELVFERASTQLFVALLAWGVVAVLCGWGLYLFFRRDRRAPRILIALFAAQVFATLTLLPLNVNPKSGETSPASLLGFGEVALWSLVWIAYLSRSQRVQDTFVRSPASL